MSTTSTSLPSYFSLHGSSMESGPEHPRYVTFPRAFPLTSVTGESQVLLHGTDRWLAIALGRIHPELGGVGGSLYWIPVVLRLFYAEKMLVQWFESGFVVLPEWCTSYAVVGVCCPLHVRSKSE